MAERNQTWTPLLPRTCIDFLHPPDVQRCRSFRFINDRGLRLEVRFAVMIFRTLQLCHRRVPKKWNCVRSFSIITLVTLNRAVMRSGKLCSNLETSRLRFHQLIGVARPICVCPARNLTSSTTTTAIKQVIEINELREMLDSKNLLLIDVREPYELQKCGKIPGAINIPCKSGFLG